MYVLWKSKISRLVQRSSIGIAIGVFAGAVFLSVIHVNAQQPTSTWLNTTIQPEVDRGVAIDDQEYQRLLELKRGYSPGFSCVDKKIAIKRVVHVNLDYYQGCWYETKLGLLDQSGRYLLEPGTVVAARINGNTRDTSTLHPTPNSQVFLELINDEATGYGNFVNFRTIETASFDHTVAVSGAITLSYKTSVGLPRLKTANSSINVQSSEVWYSQNGKWMLHTNGTGAVYRINLQTFQILSIKLRDKPAYSKIPAMADITDDGRHIAVSINGTTNSELFLVDTLTCAARESQLMITPITSCATRKLKPILISNIDAYQSIALPRFYGNDMLGIYHLKGSAYQQYILQAPDTAPAGLDYIALGDSFASGEGAFDYESGTDVEKNKCHLSKQSYPYLINYQLNLTSFHSVACSGAKMDDVLRRAQHDESPTNLGDWHPGTLAQLRMLDENDIDAEVITISMSGNDIGFGNRIKKCISSRCYSTYVERKAIVDEIDSKFNRLVEMYEKIADESAPGAKIYVLGYPKIFADNVEAQKMCAVNAPLEGWKVTMANDLVVYFNAVIKNATKKAGVAYIGVEGVFNGHRLCEASGVGAAMNGVTAGDDSGIKKKIKNDFINEEIDIKLLGQESFHPNQLGNKLYAKRLLEATNKFTLSMPVKDLSVGVPNEEKFAFLKSTDYAPPVYDYYGREMISASDYPDKVKVKVASLDAPTQPDATYEVSLHSDPISLGTVTTDSAGALVADVTIPDTVSPGLHTLHIIGPGSDSRLIDIYEDIYIGNSASDFDGNGIDDISEPCGPLVSVALRDNDNDGIDDACDAEIGEIIVADPALTRDSEPEQKELAGTTLSEPVQLASVARINTPFQQVDKNEIATVSNYDSAVKAQQDKKILGAVASGVKQSAQVMSANKAADNRQKKFLIISIITVMFFTLIVYANRRYVQKN